MRPRPALGGRLKNLQLLALVVAITSPAAAEDASSGTAAAKVDGGYVEVPIVDNSLSDTQVFYDRVLSLSHEFMAILSEAADASGSIEATVATIDTRVRMPLREAIHRWSTIAHGPDGYFYIRDFGACLDAAAGLQSYVETTTGYLAGDVEDLSDDLLAPLRRSFVRCQSLLGKAQVFILTNEHASKLRT